MNTAAEIETQGVSKTFGTFKALKDVTLKARDGDFLTLLGPSGSGKTTLLMILAGFLQPTSGRVLFNGIDFQNTPVEERGFGMVFQGYALFPHMSVRDNVAFPLKVQKRSAAQIKARTDDMIDLMGLAEHAHKKPAGLSGGQQQRVALARALAYEPPVLLLDEPFSALDKNLRGQMRDEVRRIHRDLGTTFVFVTHDQSEALALSSQIAIFDKGQLQQVGTPEDTYERPANRFVAEFLGDINILTVDRSDGTPRIDGTVVALPEIAGAPPSNHIAIRPEHIQAAETSHDTQNALKLQITDLVYEGSATRLQLTTVSGQDMVLTLPTGQVPVGAQTGTEIWAHWDAKNSVFI